MPTTKLGSSLRQQKISSLSPIITKGVPFHLFITCPHTLLAWHGGECSFANDGIE